MNTRRIVVGALGGASAGIAGLVGAVSLTRIAGDYLGFPPDLEWCLTGAVDVAGIAGGVMWTAFRGRVRHIGQPMNIVCTLVSGVGVGLDHATNAGKILGPGVDLGPWPAAAFLVGLFIPLLFTWLVHALAIIGDQAAPATRRAPRFARLRARLAAARQWRPAWPQRWQRATDDAAAVTASTVHPQSQPEPDIEPEPDAEPDNSDTAPDVGARAAARTWLRTWWSVDTQPADLVAGLLALDPPVTMSRSEASRNVKWARETLRAEREGALA